MRHPVVVAGAGVAGTAAALGAARAGARVILIDGGTGASTLSTGAIDLVAWDEAQPQTGQGASDSIAGREDGLAQALSELEPVLEALGSVLLVRGGARLLTTAGIVRPARGHDAALLDVGPMAGKRVAVARCDRPGWDADVLARAWQEGLPGGDRAPGRFVPLDAAILRHTGERTEPDADFAARHDDGARLAWMADRLREALSLSQGPFDAVVLPPSLGVEHARAATLSRLVGLPCGEPLGLPGGPAGLRFEHARDRALAAAGVERVRARVAGVDVGAAVTTDQREAVETRAVVLATGGLLGGGIEYAPSEALPAGALPPSARIPFRLTIEVRARGPVRLGARGRSFALPGSLFGVAPESLAWPFSLHPPMDAVGILTDDAGRVAAGLYAAGEVVADVAHTWLAALRTGIRAGAAAARDALGP